MTQNHKFFIKDCKFFPKSEQISFCSYSFKNCRNTGSLYEFRSKILGKNCCYRFIKIFNTQQRGREGELPLFRKEVFHSDNSPEHVIIFLSYFVCQTHIIIYLKIYFHLAESQPLVQLEQSEFVELIELIFLPYSYGYASFIVSLISEPVGIIISDQLLSINQQTRMTYQEHKLQKSTNNTLYFRVFFSRSLQSQS